MPNMRAAVFADEWVIDDALRSRPEFGSVT